MGDAAKAARGLNKAARDRRTLLFEFNYQDTTAGLRRMINLNIKIKFTDKIIRRT